MGAAYELKVEGGAFSATAGADLSAAQFTFVKLSADNTVIPCAAITDKPIGIVQNNPTSNGVAEVLVYGLSKLVASAAITAGASVGTTATGQGVTVVEGTDTTKYVMGQCVVGVAAAGSICTVALQSPHRAS